MASLTTTPSRVLRSPTVYPFAFFFGFFAAAVAVLAARLAGFLAALGALGARLGASTTGVGATAAATAAGDPPRSRMMVYARARSRRTSPTRDGLLARH